MTMRNLAIWGVIVLALVAIFGVLNSGGHGGSARQITYSEMLSRVDSGDIKSVKIHGQTLKPRIARARSSRPSVRWTPRTSSIAWKPTGPGSNSSSPGPA